MEGNVKYKIGQFGLIYPQFKDKAKAAIKHLKKVKGGECVSALYRKEVGYIDIVWGEHDPKTNKGYGLKHIIEKHGLEIKQLGYEVEDFIPIVVEFGNLNLKKSVDDKFVFESDCFRVIIQTVYMNKKKIWLLSTFDLRSINAKRT